MHGTKAGLFTLTMNQLFELLDILWRVAVQHVFAVFREVEQSRI